MKSDLDHEDHEFRLMTVLNAQHHLPDVSEAVDVLRIAVRNPIERVRETRMIALALLGNASRPRQSMSMKPYPGANRTTLVSASCCSATTQDSVRLGGGQNGTPALMSYGSSNMPRNRRIAGNPLRGP